MSSVAPSLIHLAADAAMDGSSPSATEMPMLDKHQPHTLRRSLRIVTMAWGFGAVWMYATTGAARTQFAKSMGMSDAAFGLMSAIPNLGLLLQVIASYLIERYGNRKKLFLIAGTIHRLLWILIAAIPWLPIPMSEHWWVFLAFLALTTAIANMNDPAWLIWMADLVPDTIRGRYFGRRGQLGRMVGIATTISIGFILDQAKAVDQQTLQRTISVLFIIASMFGAVDILMFKWVPDEYRKPVEQKPPFFTMLAQPLKHPAFRRFLAFRATLFFAIGYIEYYAWLYLFDVVEMSNWRANVMLVAVPTIVTMCTFPLWGRLVDRLGCRPVLLIAGVMITHGALSWMFVTKDNWWFGYFAVLSATMAWPGVELASQNILLDMADSDTNVQGGSAYIAVHSAVIGVAGICSGLFASLVVEQLHDWHAVILGWPVTYHGLLFFISAVLRLTSLIWLIGMPEPESYTTPAAFRYIVGNIYANVNTVLVNGWRGFGRMKKILRSSRR
mgnify:CR=1 FL=1